MRDWSNTVFRSENPPGCLGQGHILLLIVESDLLWARHSNKFAGLDRVKTGTNWDSHFLKVEIWTPLRQLITRLQ